MMFKMTKKYDPAYKVEVCKTIASGASTVAGMSRETRINDNTLYIWMKRYNENKEKAFWEAVIYCRKMKKWYGFGANAAICERKTKF